MIASAIGVRPRADGVVSKKPAVYWWTLWRTDFLLLGSTTAIRSQRRILLLRTHSTELKIQEHGPDVEVEIHLNQVGSILFNKNSMRKWYQSGCPPIQVSRTTN